MSNKIKFFTSQKITHKVCNFGHIPSTNIRNTAMIYFIIKNHMKYIIHLGHLRNIPVLHLSLLQDLNDKYDNVDVSKTEIGNNKKK